MRVATAEPVRDADAKAAKKGPPPAADVSSPPPSAAKQNARYMHTGRSDPMTTAAVVLDRSYPRIFVTDGTMFWYTHVVRKMGAAADRDPATSDEPVPGANNAAAGSCTPARPGRRKPANEAKSTPTVADAKRDRSRSVCVATSPTSAVAARAVHSCGPSPVRPPRGPPDASCPALVRSKVSMQLFTKMETAETNPAAFSLPRLNAANSLRDEGASTPDDSFCPMATSARSRPETRFTPYRARKRPEEGSIPGPAATDGRTIMLAPTVLPVMRSAAEMTSAYSPAPERSPPSLPSSEAPLSSESKAAAERAVLEEDGGGGGDAVDVEPTTGASPFLGRLPLRNCGSSPPNTDEASAGGLLLALLRPGAAAWTTGSEGAGERKSTLLLGASDGRPPPGRRGPRLE
mmetsp:Transcript_18208/g.52594  ORF Transcript_18208/g.52594 Transcript_18208/m.52594 type:complete len:404 (-) Transcript_18208:431-1642(-)